MPFDNKNRSTSFAYRRFTTISPGITTVGDRFFRAVVGGPSIGPLYSRITPDRTTGIGITRLPYSRYEEMVSSFLSRIFRFPRIIPPLERLRGRLLKRNTSFPVCVL